MGAGVLLAELLFAEPGVGVWELGSCKLTSELCIGDKLGDLHTRLVLHRAVAEDDAWFGNELNLLYFIVELVLFDWPDLEQTIWSIDVLVKEWNIFTFVGHFERDHVDGLIDECVIKESELSGGCILNDVIDVAQEFRVLCEVDLDFVLPDSEVLTAYRYLGCLVIVDLVCLLDVQVEGLILKAREADLTWGELNDLVLNEEVRVTVGNDLPNTEFDRNLVVRGQIVGDLVLVTDRGHFGLPASGSYIRHETGKYRSTDLFHRLILNYLQLIYRV